MNLTYDRTSKDSKFKVSNDGQYEANKAKAREDGCLPLKRFTDRGISGATEARPAYQALIAEISSSNEPRRLYVWKWDRLSRNLKAALAFYDVCAEHNVEIVSVGDPIPKSTMESSAQTRLFVAVIFMMAEFQLETIRQNVESTLSLKREAKKYLTSSVAYGYRWKAGEVIQVPEEARNVRLIYELYIDHYLGFTAIEQELFRQRKFRQEQQPFKRGHIRAILMNVIYYGRINGGKGESYMGDIKPIISKQRFDKAQRIRESRHITKHTNRHYLLKGKVVCASCGYKLTPQWVTKRTNDELGYRYYYCTNKNCEKTRINADTIEADTIRWLKDFVNGTNQFQAIKAQLSSQLRELKHQQKQSAKKNQVAKEKLLRQFESGEIAVKDFKESLQLIQPVEKADKYDTEAELENRLRKLLGLKNAEILELVLHEVKMITINEQKEIEDVILNGFEEPIENKRTDRKESSRNLRSCVYK